MSTAPHREGSDTHKVMRWLRERFHKLHCMHHNKTDPTRKRDEKVARTHVRISPNEHLKSDRSLMRSQNTAYGHRRKKPSLNHCKKPFSVETVEKKRLSRKAATVWKKPCYCRKKKPPLHLPRKILRLQRESMVMSQTQTDNNVTNVVQIHRMLHLCHGKWSPNISETETTFNVNSAAPTL